jgi:hypothetical protein
MRSVNDSSVERRIRNKMIQSAVLSPQTATIVLVALVAFALNVSVLGLPAVLWLLMGLIGVVGFVVASLSDETLVESVLQDMARTQFNPAEIKNTRARQRVQQALEYLENIRTVAQQRGGAMRIQLNTTASELNDWVEQVYRIARRIDMYEENSLLSRDRARVPDELKLLQQRLEGESEPTIRAELEESIRLRQTQLENLRALETNIKRADIQLDNTVAALGTIFAQVQLLDARDVDSSRTVRLRQSIREEVASLRDTVEAIDDVQQASTLATT